MDKIFPRHLIHNSDRVFFSLCKLHFLLIPKAYKKHILTDDYLLDQDTINRRVQIKYFLLGKLIYLCRVLFFSSD